MHKKIFSSFIVFIFLIILFFIGSLGNAKSDQNEKLEVIGIDLSEKTKSLEQLKARVERKQKNRIKKKERTVVEQGIFEGADYISVSEEQVQGNILSYSLFRWQASIWYKRDPDYLIAQDLVGKGVFVSEHMCETEVYIGQIIKEILAKRGKISEENRQYFTDWAICQLEETDWDLLDEDWEARPYAYNRDYRMSHLFGGVGYDFDYIFYSKTSNRGNEMTQMIRMKCLIDNHGMICGIQTEIDEIESKMSAMEKWINTIGLFDDTYYEPMIQRGKTMDGKIILDFFPYHRRFMSNPYDEEYENNYAGLLSSGDAALSAETVKRILEDVLESRGSHASQYEYLFLFESYFKDFKDNGWGQLEENWKMGSYDCSYVDRIRASGHVGFRYEFYPDYDAMGADTAKAVIAECNVAVDDGSLGYTNFRFFSMTKEECETAVRQKEAGNKRVALIDHGEKRSGQEKICIPYPAEEITPILLEKYQFDVNAGAMRGDSIVQLWGFSDAAEAAASFGEILLKDMAEKSNRMKIEEMFVDSSISADYDLESFLDQDDGEWKASKEYDCYYIKENERAECAHFKYYFYPERIDETQETGRVLVVDVWLSEDGIEDMEVNTFMSKGNILFAR